MTVDFYNAASTASVANGHDHGRVGLAFGRSPTSRIDQDFYFAVVKMQSPPTLSWGYVDRGGRVRFDPGNGVDLTKRLPEDYGGRIRGKTWYRVSA